MMMLRTLDDVSSIPAGLFHVKEWRSVAKSIEIGNNPLDAINEAIRIQVDGTACGQH